MVRRDKFARKKGFFNADLVSNWKRQKIHQKANNALARWYGAIEGNIVYVHSTILFEDEFLRREQNAAENKLWSLQAEKDFSKMLLVKTLPKDSKKSSSTTKTIELSLRLMHSRTILFLFSLLIFQLFFVHSFLFFFAFIIVCFSFAPFPTLYT